jgi:gamma-glutamylcyclotransferase (GGCT)/AIG2-like uncharacterized protein YtfP
MDDDRLPFFVYGTLLPGQPNAVLWGEAIEAQEKARLTGGCLYDMGSYPMLIEEGNTSVFGIVNVVSEAAYESVLARMDRLEGYDPKQPDETWYRRVAREVVLANGRSLKAWVYVGHPTAVRGMKPIPGGDWAAYTAQTFQDVEQWWQDVASVHSLDEPPDKEE